VVREHLNDHSLSFWMPPKKVKDDIKQCTLSLGGAVLSPSAKTLQDTKQPRITSMIHSSAALMALEVSQEMDVAKVEPETVPEKGLRAPDKPAHEKPKSLFDRIMDDSEAVAKEVATPDAGVVHDQVEDNVQEVGLEVGACKQEEIVHTHTQATADGCEDAKEEVGLTDLQVAGEHGAAEGEVDGQGNEAEGGTLALSQSQTLSTSQPHTQEYVPPSESATQSYDSVDVNSPAESGMQQDLSMGNELTSEDVERNTDIVKEQQTTRKRRRLQQVDSSDEEGKEKDLEEPEGDIQDEVDPTDWRERVKVCLYRPLHETKRDLVLM
jgi:hypothetical protein